MSRRQNAAIFGSGLRPHPVFNQRSFATPNDMAWNWVSDTREIGPPLRGFRFPRYSTQGDATTRFARMALPWALIGTSLWDWVHSEREGKTTTRRSETPRGLRNRVGR
jgi:hypothetical protein